MKGLWGPYYNELLEGTDNPYRVRWMNDARIINPNRDRVFHCENGKVVWYATLEEARAKAIELNAAE